ncbi:MAG: hypothetical protein AAB726_02385 [Patescibacteria group bacterium]
MYWANFLHVYQPPTQKPVWVRRIAEECYRKLFGGLRNVPRARLTININSILCELLEQNEASDVIAHIKALLDTGQIELTGSAKYHAFLPLLPESEIRRQIEINETSLTKYFGNAWKRGGFFSPEMAYSKKVAMVAKEMGYKWIIVDEMAFPPDKKFSADTLYEIESVPDFYVFFRERNFSFKILSASQLSTLPSILRFLEPRFKEKNFTITAMDGETFGHHRPGLENLLFDLLGEPRIEPIMLSDILDKNPKKEIIAPRESTWASLPKDFTIGEPFLRWHNPENIIQKKQWELVNLAIKIVEREGGARSGAGAAETSTASATSATSATSARNLLDSALHSDQFWWASARPWWSIEMVERGAHDLLGVISASKSATPEEKSHAENLYKEIIYTCFDWQRSGIVDELAKSENEEIRERVEEKEQLFVTKKEFEELRDTLNEQMKLAAETGEYHRAGMIKDRIRELEEEMKKL